MKSKFSNNLVPSLVLVIICLIVTAALAVTHDITADAIAQNEKATIEEAEKEVLPNGDGEAKQITVKSYGGDLVMMVGVSSGGEVTGVTVISHGDTPGLGTKAMDVNYLKQYIGVKELSAEKITDNPEIDAITGATISSNAIYGGVRKALGGDK